MDYWLPVGMGWGKTGEVDLVKGIKYRGVREGEMGKWNQIYGG